MHHIHIDLPVLSDYNYLSCKTMRLNSIKVPRGWKMSLNPIQAPTQQPSLDQHSHRLYWYNNLLQVEKDGFLSSVYFIKGSLSMRSFTGGCHARFTSMIMKNSLAPCMLARGGPTNRFLQNYFNLTHNQFMLVKLLLGWLSARRHSYVARPTFSPPPPTPIVDGSNEWSKGEGSTRHPPPTP